MDDYNQIITHIGEFWGSDRTLSLHHPLFIYEFGNSAFVIKDGNDVAAYLFGFLSQTEPTAYVHLVGVRAPYRRRGLARHLYQHFIQFAQANGRIRLKAITTPGNQTSIAFHQSLGMTLTGEPNAEGIPVIKDYVGSGQDRVVMEMDLP